MSETLTPLIPLMIALPMTGGALALFGKIFPSAGRALSFVSIVSILLPGLIAAPFLPEVYEGGRIVYSLGGWPEPWGISLVLDGFAWISIILVSLLSFFSGLFSFGSKKFSSAYYLFLSLMAAGLIGVALTGDLFTMFVCFEIVAIAAYMLIVYEQSPASLVAGFKYLILSSVGILFFLFGVFLIYRELGVLSLDLIHKALESPGAGVSGKAVHFALASLCVGIGVRTAFIPFHTWLPEAHAFAPHPVSALLSGVLIKISFFAMVRILVAFNGDYLYSLLLWIGALTALAAVLYALAQSDAKRLLAFHSVSQMGYILAVFGTGTAAGFSASVFHAVNHALFKSLLFLTVGMAVERGKSRNLYVIRPLGREIPLAAITFFVAAASIAGMPPFNGYASKAFISYAMKGSPAYYLIWLTGFMTVASFIKLSRIYLPSPSMSVDLRETESASKAVLEGITLFFLAVLCIAAGVFGSTVSRIIAFLIEPGKVSSAPSLWSLNKLSTVLYLIPAGILIFLGLKTGAGKAYAATVRKMMPNLHTVLVFFFSGLLIFGFAAY